MSDYPFNRYGQRLDDEGEIVGLETRFHELPPEVDMPDIEASFTITDGVVTEGVRKPDPGELMERLRACLVRR